MRLVFKFTCFFVSAIVLSSCASFGPSSTYKEVSNDGKAFREINICREGALGDNSIYHIYLDNEFVTDIGRSIFGKSRIKILVGQGVKTLHIDAAETRGMSKIFQLPLTNQSEKLYLVSESKTKNFIPIPLPGLVITSISGERKISGLTQTDFQSFCGDTSEATYSK